MRTLAYRSLCNGARALLIELKALYYGGARTNNGKLFLSIRDAALLLGAGKSSVAEWYIDLYDRGFIKPRDRATFDFKAGAKTGKATTWILTEFPYGDRPATRDFQRWVPTPQSQRVPEIISRSVLEDGSYPTADSLYPTADSPPETVPEGGRFGPETASIGPSGVPEGGRI
ncbi:hypothetical protein [uncultured Reyranella sp.]|uniref:hypothetical protein n=1 Tax=uncultured Reyranella sp. TaxID=735512 RepID=UPI0025CEE558|nr:hypothetical protein [uncultured Reyranella sp.]